jgi:hypothetical protein
VDASRVERGSNALQRRYASRLQLFDGRGNIGGPLTGAARNDAAALQPPLLFDRFSGTVIPSEFARAVIGALTNGAAPPQVELTPIAAVECFLH